MNLRELAAATNGGPQEFDPERQKEAGRTLVALCGLTPERLREIFPEPAKERRTLASTYRVPAIARQPCPFCGKPL
jgi:hypothetical protein